MSQKFSFNYEDTEYRIEETENLIEWLDSIFEKEEKSFELIEYIICSDEYLLDINKQYLDHDYYTDIITFPLSKDPIEATIFISIDRIKDNADAFKQTLEDELHRVLAHGLLHLIGYNDKTETEVKEIREKENEHLAYRKKSN